jgi:uncharacterized protein YndB with AHSA1/START domain
MKKLEFNIDINADAQKVWDTIIDPVKYKEWVGVGFPGSYFEGKWEQGENIRFLGGDEGGGTLANLEEVKPNEYIAAKHVAIINKDGSLDKTSEMAKGWVGTTENYTLSKNKNGTHFKVEMGILKPEWESMFADSWPKLLAKLKELSEKN